MKRVVPFFVLAILMLPSGAPAQTNAAISTHDHFAGTWKLLSYVRREIPSGAKSDVMGAEPSGYIQYGRDGHMMVIITASDRKKPLGPVATPAEAEALITSMLAYGGTYTIDTTSKTITHHVEVSWDQSRTGESLVRTYSLDGDRLTLTTPPSNDPATGKKSVRTLTWEKLK